MDWRTSERRESAKDRWLLGAAAVLLVSGCGSGRQAEGSSAPAGAAEIASASDGGDATPTSDDSTTVGRNTPDRAPIADKGAVDEFWNLGAGSHTVLASGGSRRSALFLCDALAQPLALALTVPDGEGWADLVSVADGGTATSRRVEMGRPDPGAGNIHYPLTADGRTIGDLHAVNTGILPGNTVPTVRSVTLDGTAHECRWAPHTRMLAVTPRRTVLVTGRHGQGQLRYRTFNHGERLAELDARTPEQGTEASLDLTGGREVDGAYRFRNGGYEYRLDPVAATLTVAQGGNVVQMEPLVAWMVAGRTDRARVSSHRARP